MGSLEQEDGPLAQSPDPRPPEGAFAEWTGLFLFAVGAFGTLYRSFTRHLAIWGVVPLDLFYALLLLGGATIMLFGSPWSPFHPSQRPASPGGRLLLRVRQGFSLVMLALLFWVSVLR